MTHKNVLAGIFDAYGGLSRWKEIDAVRARFSSGGALFTLRGQSQALLNAQVSLRTTTFDVALQFASGERRARVTNEKVVLSSKDGAVSLIRERPRASFASWRSQLSWDEMELAYFASYAIWNYLCFPFLLSDPAIAVVAVSGASHGGYAVRVKFPPEFPTHSFEQRFWFDGRSMMYRHDYVADVVGPYATAAHFADRNVSCDGIIAPHRRRVVPRLGGTAFPAPTLVWIKLHEIDYLRADRSHHFNS